MKKLLTMAESKANEHEAMVAAKQLHAMLAKHNISIESLNEDEEGIGKEGIMQKCRPWKRIVAMYVAKLYFCEFYTFRYGNGKSDYMFVGTEVNRSFAIHIFKMIIITIEKQSRAESRKLYGKENSSFVNSFWTGAKDRIVERCNELMDQAKSGNLEDEEGDKLPALLSTYESMKIKVEGWMSDNLELKEYKARTRSTNQLGKQKGREAGNRVQLSRALQSNSSPKLLGGING